ncbi:MAG: sulfatase-like hydrolase/transferase [Planctomycetaceae bacterium]|jgi:arylsulfatase A-like enzyme/acetyl esterase/lipase|nr:sulfatase-like hydrolase/transferase [Planctomycetaceae bacterium]
MKRLFLTAAALVTAICAHLSPQFTPVYAADARPNFLFVYADDQRYDQVGVVQREQGEKGRYPWFQAATPNMDRLAESGVRFRNAFASSSLCAPSRAAFLTGRYNHENGIASNFRELPLTTVTHSSLLRQSGYVTGYFGKWHMGGQKVIPNFDFHATLIGHGRYFDCPLIVQGVETPTTGWVDDVVTDYAVKFIEQQKETGKPWSVVVGLKSPHGPQTPPERNATLYEGEQARTVPNLEVQAIYLEKQGIPFKKEQVTENGLVPANLDKFRCVKANDQNLGRLLDTLDRLGVTENTIVIYTSDNGFYFGEHGLGDKRSAYEESLRIPFLVRFPKLGKAAQGRVVDEPILNIDLLPTLLDYAGVPVPQEIQGRSWRPLLEGTTASDWRKSWFYEYFAEKQRNSQVVDVTGVRTLKAKLIKYSTKDGVLEDWTELFDLANDPYELKNLYNNKKYAGLRRELEQEYDRLKKEVRYQIPDYADRPVWWEKGLPEKENESGTKINTVIKEPGIRLEFTFEKDNTEQITDSSGQGNHGIPHGKLTGGQGQNGEPAKRFDGNSFIELKKTPSLVFAGLPWLTEVVFKSDKPDGVLVAVGGKSQGYSLRLDGGKLVFTVTVDNERFQIVSPEPVSDWVKAAAQFTADKKFILFVDGKPVAEKQLVSLVEREPNFAYRIGADSDGEAASSAFTGVISSIKLTAYHAGSTLPTPTRQNRRNNPVRRNQRRQSNVREPAEQSINSQEINISAKQNADDSFVVLENIPYVKDGGTRQQLDLYLPKNDETATPPVPLVVVIHGGGWANGSKDLAKFIEWSRFFAENGYAVAAINYRLRPEFLLPAQIIDCKSAVRWLRANAKKYNIDTNHFAVMGSSAGGHLSASLGTSDHVKEFDQGEYLDQSSSVQAVVDFCGPSDFFAFHTENNNLKAAALFGENADNEDLIKKSSPLHTVTQKSAPFLIVHAVDDKTVRIEQGRTLHEALQKAGVESRLHELSFGGHGSQEFSSPETKKQIIEFLAKHLKNKHS